MTTEMSKYPVVNENIIKEHGLSIKEYDRIVDASQCDWIEDLITAVFWI